MEGREQKKMWDAKEEAVSVGDEHNIWFSISDQTKALHETQGFPKSVW